MIERCVDSIRVVSPLFQEEDGGSIPTSTLQLNFRTVDVRTCIQLNRLWHSRLPKVIRSNVLRCRRNVFYAAEFDGLYYASAIWTDPVAENRLKDGHICFELRRLAICDEAPKNTASRMLGWMVRDIKRRFPDLVKLISYQDTEVHFGTIYKASGWSMVETAGLTEWTTEKRIRNVEQSKALKIRWEKSLS